MIIDIFNEVYDNLKTILTDCTVLPSYPSTVPTFPCVTMEEILTTTDDDTRDSAGDHHNDISFEINIFTNSALKLSQQRDIRKRVDDLMNGTYRMTRSDARKVPNFIDGDINRYLLRYSFKIDESKTIHRG